MLILLYDSFIDGYVSANQIARAVVDFGPSVVLLQLSKVIKKQKKQGTVCTLLISLFIIYNTWTEKTPPCYISVNIMRRPRGWQSTGD